MKFVATIQARMGSTRLPGKVLKKAGGKPLLLHQLQRIKQAILVDEVIVATTNKEQDDPIVQLCKDHGVKYFRGSEDDVLGRVTTCLLPYKDWGHVELVGDSPYVDPQIVDSFIGYYLKHQEDIDYVSNGIDISYPNGAEVNVYAVNSLIEANNRVELSDPMREHVDVHLYQSGHYQCVNLEAPYWLKRPDLYIEIDTENDYQVLKSIADYFETRSQSYFSLYDIIQYLTEHPEIAKINRQEFRKYWEIKEKNNV